VVNERPDPGIEQARQEVQRLMPDSVRGRADRAMQALGQLKYAETAKLLAEARELSRRQTRDTVGILTLEHDEGIFLQGIDAADRSLVVYTRYLTRNPLSTRNEGDVALAYAGAGRDAEARREILNVFERIRKEDRLGPSARLSARVIALSNLSQPGMRPLLDEVAFDNGTERQLFDLLDHPAEARRQLQGPMAPKAERNFYDSYVLALWSAYYSEPALALGHLRNMRASEVSLGHWLLPILWQPLMKDVRMLPQYKDFVRELGLVEYWRSSGWGSHCKPVGDTDFECH